MKKSDKRPSKVTTSYLAELFNNSKFQQLFYYLLIKQLDLRKNKFHPLVFILGSPKIGKNVSIGFFSEVNANASKVFIGNNCDIASFVSINTADSHKRTLGLTTDIERKPIVIENNVFIGSHSFIGQNVHIGHHSVIGAGTILINKNIPPFSLAIGNPVKLKKNYYKK